MKEDISIVFSGEAGQGIKTIEQLLLKILKSEGIHIFSTSEVMSRIRGGNNTTEIRISNKPVYAFVDRIDILFVLGKEGVERLENRINKNTKIIADKKRIEDVGQKQYKITDIPVTQLAKEAGGMLYGNTIFVGIILGMLGLDPGSGKKILTEKFSKKGDTIVQNNIKALEMGVDAGKDQKTGFVPKKGQYKQEDISILSGNDAVGIGALSGGCNFIASYPMSPGTTVLTFLSKQAENMGIVAEQAEDEIAAINMAIGAWYAGARAMVTTSGGGFALMEEGISLAGILETPVVAHIAQRPGPATGLPTRTEQGDLLFSVFSGHGEFPKIILAPGTPEEGIEITHKAFDLADKYKVPVIILTDQYYLESYANRKKPDIKKLSVHKDIVKTTASHKTYEITKNGISPRGIPGHGKGFVCVDSDEHDEYGRITEHAEVRQKMMDKRMRKLNGLHKDEIQAEVMGNKNSKNIVIGWGSTYGVIKEAMENLSVKDTAFVHFKQVFPLPSKTKELLSKAKNIISIENNATGQFAKLLAMETGIMTNYNILQYNGFPFSVERIEKELKNLL